MKISLASILVLPLLLTACGDSEALDQQKKENRELKDRLRHQVARESQLQSQIEVKAYEYMLKKIEVNQLSDKIGNLEAELKKAQSVSNSENNKVIEDLKRQINATKAQLETTQKQLASSESEKKLLLSQTQELKAKSLELAKTLEQEQSKLSEMEKKLSEALARTNVADETELLKNLKREISESQILVQKLENEKKQLSEQLTLANQTLELSLSEVWGIYAAPKSIKLGQDNCRQFFHMNEKGKTVQALVCESGKVQLSRDTVESLDAVSLGRGVGLKLSTRLGENSCQGRPSSMRFGGEHKMDRSTRFGANTTLSFLMESTLNDKATNLESLAITFQNNECDALRFQIANADPNMSLEKKTLGKQAALVCDLAEEKALAAEWSIGCFDETQEFILQ